MKRLSTGLACVLLCCGFSLRLQVSNPPTLDSARLETVIEGSRNLRNWYVVAKLPYATNTTLLLTNRPDWEFYRAYNAKKQN